METHPIAKIIAENGVRSVNTAMFRPEEKAVIYSQAADILLRLNKFDEAFKAMELSGRPLPVEWIKQVAHDRMGLGQYQAAYELLVMIGDKELAQFVKTNFL